MQDLLQTHETLHRTNNPCLLHRPPHCQTRTDRRSRPHNRHPLLPIPPLQPPPHIDPQPRRQPTRRPHRKRSPRRLPPHQHLRSTHYPRAPFPPSRNRRSVRDAARPARHGHDPLICISAPMGSLVCAVAVEDVHAFAAVGTAGRGVRVPIVDCGGVAACAEGEGGCCEEDGGEVPFQLVRFFWREEGGEHLQEGGLEV